MINCLQKILTTHGQSIRLFISNLGDRFLYFSKARLQMLQRPPLLFPKRIYRLPRLPQTNRSSHIVPLSCRSRNLPHMFLNSLKHILIIFRQYRYSFHLLLYWRLLFMIFLKKNSHFPKTAVIHSVTHHWVNKIFAHAQVQIAFLNIDQVFSQVLPK